MEENVEVKQSDLIDYDSIPEATETLNEGQLNAFKGLVGFLASDSRMAVIVGYAGTGKTYMIGKLLSICDGKKAATAPTNKAVKVLRENGGFGDVTYDTIHKLLALTIRWKYPPKGVDKDPEQILVRNRRANPTIHEYDILIVDEVSMLSDELFEMLYDERYKHVKIIFSGDPAQIPPVGFEDSIPLLADRREEYGIVKFELNEIMRQKGDSSIVQTAYAIRQGRYHSVDPIKDRSSEDDIFFYSSNYKEDKQEFVAKMLKGFTSEDFSEDANYCKLLAWTNKTVDAFNLLIRKHVFKTNTPSPIMTGEQLIADKPIIDGENIIFSTSDEFEVVSFIEREESFEKPLTKAQQEKQKQEELELDAFTIQSSASKNIINLKYYDCIVKYKTYDTKEYFEKNIRVLTPESEKAYSWLLSSYKKAEDWGGYTDMIQYFAKTKYNYAITCHKAQGSTYQNVFIIEDDIDKNYKALERNRIKYTAVTRASKQLNILSHKNRRHTNG